MIWFLFALLALFSCVVLFAPSRPARARQSSASEIAAYVEEIKRLEDAGPENDKSSGSDNNNAAKIIDLKRQILKLTDAGGKTHTLSKGTMAGLSLFLIAACAGLYMHLGSPEISTQTQITENVQTPPPEDLSLGQLMTEFERQLAGEKKNDPEGWRLYARLLMTGAKYPEAFGAYEKALSLSGGDADIREEYEKAQSFAAKREAQNMSGPTQDDIEAAGEMSAEGRQQMITSMVDGLAAKLEDNPNDPESWIRLLRSRGVLGQTELARKDIARLQELYKDEPDTLARIFSNSGWAPRPPE